jgi:hypothetical protein|tara:strand:- start:13 stop:255 length:243 start_codon:yes stop_codon:yes gene_type:complete
MKRQVSKSDTLLLSLLFAGSCKVRVDTSIVRIALKVFPFNKRFNRFFDGLGLGKKKMTKLTCDLFEGFHQCFEDAHTPQQ